MLVFLAKFALEFSDLHSVDRGIRAVELMMLFLGKREKMPLEGTLFTSLYLFLVGSALTRVHT